MSKTELYKRVQWLDSFDNMGISYEKDAKIKNNTWNQVFMSNEEQRMTSSESTFSFLPTIEYNSVIQK